MCGLSCRGRGKEARAEVLCSAGMKPPEEECLTVRSHLGNGAALHPLLQAEKKVGWGKPGESGALGALSSFFHLFVWFCFSPSALE